MPITPVPGSCAACGDEALQSMNFAVTAPGNGILDINPLMSAGYTTMRWRGLAGGSGGASGRQGAAGTVRCGGGTGAVGAFVDVSLVLTDLLLAFPTGLVPYNVGAGSAGGAAVTTPDTNGTTAAFPTAVNGTWIGAPFGPLSFAIARAPFTGGFGGTATSGTSGFPQSGTIFNPFGSSADTLGGPGFQGILGCSGPGGGITAADVPGNGGNGLPPSFGGGFAGTGGTVGGASPDSGVLGPRIGPGVPPGGGAASILVAAQAGAAALANTGAGGGGGGASLNGNDSGAGGDGGDGFMLYTVMA